MKRIIIFMVLVLCCFGVKGQGWFELGTGANALNANNPILTLCIDDSNNIYAAGTFTDSIDGLGPRYVAKWDNVTHSWRELGAGSSRLNANESINTTCADKSGNIYAAGNFTDKSSSHFPFGYKYVAKWTATSGSWSELGTGANALYANDVINSICVDDSGNVYAAGNFEDAYGSAYVAKWNGAYWTELGTLNTSYFINSICVDDSQDVYAGGSFMDSAGYAYVAKWSNVTGTWTKLGSGFDYPGKDIQINSVKLDSANNVYAAVNIVDTPVWICHSNVFKWDGANWDLLGDTSNALNANENIFSICLGDSGFVYAAGVFTDTRGYTFVAKYSPVSGNWNELGAGTIALNPHNSYGNAPPIFTVCTDINGNVYAGGGFSDSISSANNFCYVAEYGISTLGIVSIADNNGAIEVYPNPTTDNLNIRCTLQETCYCDEYYIYDLLGRVCLAGSLNKRGNTVIDMNSLPSGLYLLFLDGYKIKIIKN